MQLPIALLNSLEEEQGFDKDSFIRVHNNESFITSIRYNPLKWPFGTMEIPPNPAVQDLPFFHQVKVPWSSYGYYLLERPSFTFDPHFHAGMYYVQEASSMFLEQAIRQTSDLTKPLRVLDLCAAPGGKSTLVQSLLNIESLLVSNDVIKSRVAVLEETITKWGSANVVVTNNDPKDFARLENYFDLIILDAPCSGSGLFRKNPSAIDQWSENNVELCRQRQQRIVADVWPALGGDGILIYSTCSYSKQENEDILDWIVQDLGARSLPLAIEKEWKIVDTRSLKKNAFGYRFYPDKVKGEGFFIAVVQKRDGDAYNPVISKKSGLEKLSRAEEDLVKPWLKEGTNMTLFKQGENIVGVPNSLENEITALQSALYIKKAGVTLGKLTFNALIPDHALALSMILHKNIVSIPLNKDQAIQYLRKEEVQINTNHKGWALVNYVGSSLGWIKSLPNRINNYYPKEWRILKQP